MTRLIVAYVVAGAVGGAVAVATIQAATRTTLREEAEQRNADLATVAALRLDDRIITRAHELELLASNRSIIGGGSAAQEELDVAARLLPEFDELVLYDRDGHPVGAASEARLVALDDVPRGPRVTAADPTPRFTIRTRTGTEPLLEYAVPVQDPPGTAVGTVVGIARLEEVGSFLLAPTDSSTIRYLVGPDGTVLVHPDTSKVIEARRLDAVADVERHGVVPGDAGEVLVGKAATSRIDAFVVVEQALESAMAPAAGDARQLALIAALIIAIAVAVMSFFGERMLRPIGALAEAAKRVGGGEHSVRVPEHGPREVATLAQEFNRMAESLERRIQELHQHRVTESELRTEARLVGAMHRIGTALSAELDDERVIETVTDAGRELSGAEFGAFFYNELDESGEKYMLYALSGAPREAFEGFPMPRNTEIFSATFSGERIVRLDDVTQDPRFGKNPPYHGLPAGHLPVRSYLAVPVVSRTGEVHGGMFFGHSRPGVFTEREERLLSGLAAQAAVAIDNARLYDSERSSRREAEQARERLTVVADAGRILAGSIDLDETVRNVARLAVPRLADVCVVDIVAEDGSIARMAAEASPQLEEIARGIVRFPPDPSNAEHPVVRALRTGRPEIIEVDPETIRSAARDRAHASLVEPLLGNSAVVVPIPGREVPIGAISMLALTSDGRRFVQDDLELANELARRASMAIESARLYAEQRTVAQTLQHSLLPERIPSIPGLETAVRYLPGGGGVNVGGDWFDVFELPSGAVAVAMGDVVGRGIRAASVMGQLRNALRAYAMEGHGPGEALRHLNRLMIDTDPDHFATVIFGVFDQESGTVELCNAGHPPALVIAPDGSCAFLGEGRNPPLGAVAAGEFTEELTTLEPGSTFLVYTDGLIERHGSSLDDGFRILEQAAQDAHTDVAALCDRLIERSLSLGAADDDVAVLALRVLPIGPEFKLRVPSRPAVLAPLRSTMRRWLSSVGVRDDETYEILVAVGEACTNAIEHGSPALRSEFELDASADGKLVIAVRDRGRWRPERETSRGRGLKVIEAFMDEVDIETTDEGTTIVMRRELNARGDA